MADTGIVYLVGAGPGDPELLTLKALRLIEAADVVVYDRLVSPQILALVPETVSRIDVGKRPGSHPVPQNSINEILLKLARSGQKVVRLKGGDPMIFGRGGEEAAMLASHGISVETVPGITAAQGCAATLNLPLTHRSLSQSLIYLTGHTVENQIPDMDWQNLANKNNTLVIYMGAAKITQITDNLIAHGLSSQTPALAICNGTLDKQAQVLGTVSTLAGDARAAEFDGPVLFILGRSVGLISEMNKMELSHDNSSSVVASN